MNFTANTTALAQELRLLNQIVPTKPALPILSNVLIHAEMGTLRFVTTDLEVTFLTTCRAHIEEPGVVTLPVKRLLDIIEQLPDTDIQISTDRAHVHLQSGSYRSRLQALPPDDFPAVPEVTGEPSAMPTAPLQAMIRRVRYAISSKGKYVINGALLTLTDGVAAMVTTDGKRLSLSTMAHKGLPTTTVVPDKTLDAITALFTEPHVSFSQSDRHLFFQAGERLLISRTLEMKFPAYERVIPKGHPFKALVDRAALAAALRRVGLVSEEDMSCYFSFSTGVLDLHSSSAQIGEAAERLGISYEGEPLKLCCNWQFVLDFLEVVERPTVKIEVKDINSPMLLTDGEDHLAVIMLMRM